MFHLCSYEPRGTRTPQSHPYGCSGAGAVGPDGGVHWGEDGMYLRQWYIGKALEGAAVYLRNANGNVTEESVAAHAISVADAVLELDKLINDG